MESFYLGDRQVGAWVTAISASASSESGWLVLGLVAMGYIYGVAAFWVTLGCVLGFAFNWMFFADRVRGQSAVLGAITVPGFLERATGARTPAIRLIGVLIIFVLMFTYVAAQLNAAGVALEAVFSWPYWVGVLLGAAVTILYTTVGGFRAVSWTDLFQGLLMAAALVILPIIAFLHLGSWGAVESAIRAEPAQKIYVMKGWVDGDRYAVFRVEDGKPVAFFGDGEAEIRQASLRVENGQLVQEANGALEPLPAPDGVPTFDLSVIGREGMLELDAESSATLTGGDAFFSLGGGMTTLALFGWIVGMLGIGLGYPGSPHVVARFMAARSSREIRRGRVIAITWALLAEGGAVTLGILARALFPDLPDPEWGLLWTAKAFLPAVVVGLIVAAVFAALRSTADSQLLVASSAVVRDLCQSVLGMDLDERRAMRISRLVVIVLGLLAVGLALTQNRFIFWFVLFSWAGLGASFAPPLILAVSWKRLSPAGVVAAMLVGFTTTLVWKLWIREAIQAAGGPDIYELVPAFLLSFLAAVAFSLLFPRREQGETP